MIDRIIMIKNSVILFFGAILMLFISCNHKTHQEESPLAIVIKLISAESFADIKEAKKYIDIEKVYANNVDTLLAEETWRGQILFSYNISKDKRFTNHFKYYDYNIKETQDGKSANVVFEAKSPESIISAIVYTLTQYNEAWKVCKIEYVKRKML